MAKTAKVFTINVQVDSRDKALLERLAKRSKLKRTDVIRLLIRYADASDLKLAANG